MVVTATTGKVAPRDRLPSAARGRGEVPDLSQVPRRNCDPLGGVDRAAAAEADQDVDAAVHGKRRGPVDIDRERVGADIGERHRRDAAVRKDFFQPREQAVFPEEGPGRDDHRLFPILLYNFSGLPDFPGAKGEPDRRVPIEFHGVPPKAGMCLREQNILWFVDGPAVQSSGRRSSRGPVPREYPFPGLPRGLHDPFPVHAAEAAVAHDRAPADIAVAHVLPRQL